MSFLPLLITLIQPEPIPELTVSPAPAPTPVLKNELLPRVREKHAGNAAVGYFQAILLHPSRPSDAAKAKALAELDETFRSKPIEEISVRELTEYLKSSQPMFRQADLAARCQSCDWQREGQQNAEGLMTLLPELQQHRELARMLALRIRLAAIDGKFDEAISHAKTAFQHAKHVAEGPTLVQMLVGLAIVNVHLKQIEDIIQRPGSPNLYWALSTLPRPFIDHRPGLEGEERFLNSILPGIPALEAGPVTPDQAVAQVETLIAAMSESGEASAWRTLTSKVGVVGYAAMYKDEAKNELIEKGRTAKSLEGMSPSQIVLLRILSQYRELMDEQAVIFTLPLDQAASRRDSHRKKLQSFMQSKDPLVALMARMLPTTDKVYGAFARTERRIDFLRTIEAIRMQASGGTWPTTLDAIKSVPLPRDPMTGKPFEMISEKGRLSLKGPAPSGDAETINNAMTVILKIRK